MRDRRAAGKAVLLALCWILSFAAFSIPLYTMDRFSLFLQVLVPAALIFGYMSLWYVPRVFVRWQLWIAAAVFAAVATVGASFDYTGSAEFVTNHPWRALLYFLGRVPAFYMGMVLLVDLMRKGMPPYRRYHAGVYALFVFVCWLPYLVAVWPGAVSAAAAMQLEELSGAAALGTQGPLLQTGLTGLAVWIGKGVFGTTDAAVALYGIVQALLAAWLIGRAVTMIGDGGAPKWLVLASVLFFALCPIFPLYAFAISANMSFALAALWLMTAVWRIVRGETASRFDVVSLCLSAVLCTLLGAYGFLMVLASLAALLLWTLIRRNGLWLWKGAAYALICAACALLITQGALLPYLETISGAKTGMQPAAAQETAGAALQYGYLMPGFVSRTSPTFLWGTGGTVSPGAAAMEAVFARLLTYAPFRILASPGLYGWIALFALAVLLARRRRKPLVYLIAPLAALAGCLVSDLNGAMGYALPVCFAAPAFLAAAAQAVRHDQNPEFS